jgi:hypothetical protein
VVRGEGGGRLPIQGLYWPAWCGVGLRSRPGLPVVEASPCLADIARVGWWWRHTVWPPVYTYTFICQFFSLLRGCVCVSVLGERL